MVQIGNVAEINEVKDKLNELKDNGAIKDWELPYEDLLTRLDAAKFFLSPSTESDLSEIWKELAITPRFQYQENDSKTLSQLPWQIDFSKSITEPDVAVN